MVWEDVWKHQAFVRRNCQAFCKNVADAADLEQEVMLRAFTHMDSVKHAEFLKSWLYTVIRSVGCNLHRKRSKRTVFCDGSFLENLVVVDYQPQYEARSVVKLILAFVRRQPKIYRDVFYLVVIKGLPQQDVAMRMGIGRATVCLRVKRLRDKIKKNFDLAVI